MFSYIKSLTAVGLALLAVIGVAAWFGGRTRVLETLKKEKRDTETQVAETRGYSAVISQLEERDGTLCQNIADITGRFVGKHDGGLRLVKAVVESASASGVEMTGVAEAGTKDTAVSVKTMSYKISLQGTYDGLVKFFQNVAAWELKNKIESLKISAAAAEDEESEGEVKVDLVLSIFSSLNYSPQRH